MRAPRLLTILLAAAIPGASPALGDVMLNEIVVKGSERVELFNSGPGAVDVNGWTIEGGGGTHVIQGRPLLGAGAYDVVDLPANILTDNGGFIELLDDAGPTGQDGVSYGQFGGAPLPPETGFSRASMVAPSLARAPDGSAYSMPPPSSPGGDGLIWTLDYSPTFGAVNDAPTPSLGSTLLLNEVDPKPVGGMDMVELFNPSALPVSVAGWLMTNGVGTMTLSGSVAGGGFLTLTTDAGFDIETHELLYLFDALAVRVDQLGFHLPPVRSSAPVLESCECYARFADGAGPNVGYDWFSSGGSVTLFPLDCTQGTSNAFESGCAATGVDSPLPETWGRVKAKFR